MIVVVFLVLVTNLCRLVPVSVPNNILTYSDILATTWRSDQSRMGQRVCPLVEVLGIDMSPLLEWNIKAM